MLWFRDRRGAVSVEGLDGLQSPGLPFGAVGLRPDDGFPIGVEDEIAATGEFDAVATGL